MQRRSYEKIGIADPLPGAGSDAVRQRPGRRDSRDCPGLCLWGDTVQLCVYGCGKARRRPAGDRMRLELVQGGGAAPRHVRLLLMDGAVYAEDLFVPDGTQANGMGFQGVRCLHSGDEFAAGGVAIRLKF